jgi:hypothetical protein
MNPIGSFSTTIRAARPVSARASNQKPKLLAQVRVAMRSRHYSKRTEQTYVHWIKRYIFFHDVRHPEKIAETEVNEFLTHFGVKEKVSASFTPHMRISVNPKGNENDSNCAR